MMVLRMTQPISAMGVTVATHFLDRGFRRNSPRGPTRPIPGLDMEVFSELDDNIPTSETGFGHVDVELAGEEVAETATPRLHNTLCFTQAEQGRFSSH